MTRTAVTLVPDSAVIRDLRVTDIRCHVEHCDAAPGEECLSRVVVRGGSTEYRIGPPHQPRIDEHAALVAAGWQWQEPAAKEPPQRSTFALCCARVRSPSGATWFCSLADGHDGDHHGLSRGELAQADFGPGRRR